MLGGLPPVVGGHRHQGAVNLRSIVDRHRIHDAKDDAFRDDAEYRPEPARPVAGHRFDPLHVRRLGLDRNPGEITLAVDRISGGLGEDQQGDRLQGIERASDEPGIVGDYMAVVPQRLIEALRPTSLSDISAPLAEELRRPLLAIRTCAALLEQRPDDATVRRELARVVLDATGAAPHVVSMLIAGIEPDGEGVRLSPEQLASGACDHGGETALVFPGSERVCAECHAIDHDWVHLRVCLSCGYVGCCDSSPGRHARQHFNRTKHPIIRSFEPGEDWAYCYIDQVNL